jgi:serine/threonine-protein phosphatase PGAM5
MGNRTLILIRHGQYHQHPKHSEYGRLTAVGVRQALRLAKRLVEYRINALHTSPMPRALETAALIRKQLPGVPNTCSRLLLEGIPTRIKGLTREQRQRVPAQRARMDTAFARYFRPTLGKDRIELLVCHGNILRYLLRRAIDDPPHKWWRSDVMHCSLSAVVIRPDGTARILAFNDVGHLPRSLQEFA